VTDWATRFKLASARYRAEQKGADFGADFGSNYNGNSGVMSQVQQRLNALSMATPPLTVDGRIGPLTVAAIKKFQSSKGLNPDGVVGDQTLAALGITSPADVPTNPQGTTVAPSTTPYSRVVATAAAALRQVAKSMGYTLSDSLLSMMLAQINNESAFGVTGSMAGTNNWGAAQATKAFATKHAGETGFGAFGHKDTDPTTGAFLGWYWIAPSPLAAAHVWLAENWWGGALLRAQPSTPTAYSSILYSGGYFGGSNKPERPLPPRPQPFGPNEQKNVDAYASGIAGAMGRMAGMMNGPADDPSVVTVRPDAIPPPSKRYITEDLFTKALHGAWASWLPASFADFLSNNGVIWFGPAPVATALMKAGTEASFQAIKKVGVFTWILATVGGILGLKWIFDRKK
jgi:peptidoglycan hydrolase-like protein with peptidoglycan-binding domain